MKAKLNIHKNKKQQTCYYVRHICYFKYNFLKIIDIVRNNKIYHLL